jgi:hypothetical protein
MRLHWVWMTFVAAGFPGCFLVTGSTDGYQLVDAGSDGQSCEGAPCPTSLVQCTTAADCVSEAGPNVCVLQSCVFAGTTFMIRACGNLPTCSAL